MKTGILVKIKCYPGVAGGHPIRKGSPTSLPPQGSLHFPPNNLRPLTEPQSFRNKKGLYLDLSEVQSLKVQTVCLGFVSVQREKPHCLSAPWFVAVLLKLPSHAVGDLVGTKFPGSHPQRFQFGSLGWSLWPGTSNKLTGMARWYRCYWSKDLALNIASF